MEICSSKLCLHLSFKYTLQIYAKIHGKSMTDPGP